MQTEQGNRLMALVNGIELEIAYQAAYRMIRRIERSTTPKESAQFEDQLSRIDDRAVACAKASFEVQNMPDPLIVRNAMLKEFSE
jgi:hypothetical protein